MHPHKTNFPNERNKRGKESAHTTKLMWPLYGSAITICIVGNNDNRCRNKDLEIPVKSKQRNKLKFSSNKKCKPNEIYVVYIFTSAHLGLIQKHLLNKLYTLNYPNVLSTFPRKKNDDEKTANNWRKLDKSNRNAVKAVKACYACHQHQSSNFMAHKYQKRWQRQQENCLKNNNIFLPHRFAWDYGCHSD